MKHLFLSFTFTFLVVVIANSSQDCISWKLVQLPRHGQDWVPFKGARAITLSTCASDKIESGPTSISLEVFAGCEIFSGEALLTLGKDYFFSNYEMSLPVLISNFKLQTAVAVSVPPEDNDCTNHTRDLQADYLLALESANRAVISDSRADSEGILLDLYIDDKIIAWFEILY
jgi:hypothetical protein